MSSNDIGWGRLRGRVFKLLHGTPYHDLLFAFFQNEFAVVSEIRYLHLMFMEKDNRFAPPGYLWEKGEKTDYQ